MLEASASHNPLENERRTRIRRRLRLVGPGPAGAYEDALQLMFAEQCAKPLNALPQLIGHLFRETESALRSVLDPQTTREGKSKDAHKASIERVLTHLDVPTNSPLRSAWVRFAQDDDRRLSAWVHRNNLLGPKFPHAELEALFEDFEQVLDGVLEHFEAHYFRYRSKVDALIRKENPTKADVEFLQQHAPHDDVTFRRFFQGVSNPQWLPLLQEGGYFRGIPSAVRDGDNVSFPVWLPVLALQRLGKVSPEEVAGILFSLEETDNDWVTGYLMDVALSFPPKLAAKWAKREARRMRTVATAYLWLPSSCQKMIEYLAKEREFAAALELATAMLGLNAEPDKRPSIDYAFEVKREGERKMTVMKIGQYEYEEIAKAVVEQLTSYFGIRVVELFAGQLEFAIQHDGYEKEPPEDHSYSWRPAIGDSERNYRGNVHQSLVTPLRDAALRLAQDESTRSTVIQYLLAQKWQVFWRLAMYITVLRCKPSDPAVAQLLKAKQWGDQWYALPEYFLLLRHAFKAMSDGQKAKCLDWVEHLPNLSAGIASFKEGQGFGQEMGAFLSFFAAGGSIPTHVVLDPEQDQGEYTLGVKPAFRGDGEWVLDRLIKSLKWTKGSTWMHDTELARKFSNFADDELQGKAIKALRMLVESNRQDFGLSFWIRDAEALIKSAAKAEGRESREECYRLINILGSVGIDDYRALLPVERGGVPAEQSDQVKAEAATKLPAKDRKPKSKTKQRQSSAPKGRSKQHGRAKGPSTKRRKKGR